MHYFRSCDSLREPPGVRLVFVRNDIFHLLQFAESQLFNIAQGYLNIVGCKNSFNLRYHQRIQANVSKGFCWRELAGISRTWKEMTANVTEPNDWRQQLLSKLWVVIKPYSATRPHNLSVVPLAMSEKRVLPDRWLCTMDTDTVKQSKKQEVNLPWRSAS